MSSRACVATSRVLFLLMLVLLAIMPVTEYFWHFDEFISGGQDFEFGLLAALIFFGLVLVLLQHGRLAIRLLVAIRIWSSLVFRKARSEAHQVQIGLMTSRYATPPPSPALRLYILPIQV